MSFKVFVNLFLICTFLTKFEVKLIQENPFFRKTDFSKLLQSLFRKSIIQCWHLVPVRTSTYFSTKIYFVPYQYQDVLIPQLVPKCLLFLLLIELLMAIEKSCPKLNNFTDLVIKKIVDAKENFLDFYGQDDNPLVFKTTLIKKYVSFKNSPLQ